MNKMNKNKSNFYYVDEKIPAECLFTGETIFKAYAEKWLENSEKDLALKTVSRYRDLLVRVNAGIGHIPLGKLDAYHLTEFYRKLAQDGANMRTGKGLSDKTILHHHRLISVILRNATRERAYNSFQRSRQRPHEATES